VTACIFRGNPPMAGLAGLTLDHAGASIRVGPQFFDENVQVFPGAFDDIVPPGTASQDVDDVTIQVVNAIKAAALVSSVEKDLAMRTLGRLYGETLAHEIGHTLIGAALGAAHNAAHNTSPGLVDDLMNNGADRSFEKRTGFVVNATQIGVVDLTTLLSNDRGIAFINIPTADAKAVIDRNFPVPSAFH